VSHLCVYPLRRDNMQCTMEFRPVAFLLRSASTKYRSVHCKNVRISTDILWRVIPILTEPVPYTCVSVNRRNNEARAHCAMCMDRASLFRPFTDTNVYGTGSVKMGENSLRNIRGYTDIFTVYSDKWKRQRESERLRILVGCHRYIHRAECRSVANRWT